ncbi:MAG: peptidoglycan-binding protein [Clostridia bacterium]|nr:peptidoglycan-binding protein [Clostridia bacterium]
MKKEKISVFLAAILCVFLLLLPPSCAGDAVQDTVGASGTEEQFFPEGHTLIEPNGESPDYVELLLGIARNEIGYTEDRYGNTKYGQWAGDPDAEWCAEFLCWCVDRVDATYQKKLLKSTFPLYSSSNTGRDWFISSGRYIARNGNVPGWGTQWFIGENEQMKKNSYIPQPGDWMFFSVNSTGDTSHVAMVEFCTLGPDGKIYVHVIEGNNPDAVARNMYPIDNWAIQGYGTVTDLAGMTMRRGCEGVKVKELQEKLILVGFLAKGYDTGVFGSLTVKAVTDFQKKNGINPTGVATQTTQLTLDKRVNEYYSDHPDLWGVDE